MHKCTNAQMHNIYLCLHVQHTQAKMWTIDGTLDDCAVRIRDDPDLSLEVNQRKYKDGDTLSVWSCDGHPEWACRWHFNSVGSEALEGFGHHQMPYTLSPVDKGKVRFEKASWLWLLKWKWNGPTRFSLKPCSTIPDNSAANKSALLPISLTCKSYAYCCRCWLYLY